MADKVLSAVFKATDQISDDLDEIASSAEEVSDSLNAAATAAEDYTSAVDDAADETDDLNSSLENVFESAAQATAGLEGVEEAAQDAGEKTRVSAVSAAGYGAALDYVASSAVESVAPQVATASAMDLVGEQADEATEEVVEYASSLSLISGTSLSSLSPSIPDVDKVSTPDVDISQPEVNISSPNISDLGMSGGGSSIPSLGDVFGGGGGSEIDTGELDIDEFEERVGAFQSALANLPDISFEAESAAQLSDNIAEARNEARSLVGLLSLTDIDIADIGSVGELTSQLDGADGEAEALARQLRGTSGASRDFLNSALRASEGSEELAEQLAQTTSKATTTASSIEKLAGETGGMVDEVIAASGSFHTLAEAVDEYGDEANESIAETISLSNALEALGLSGSTAYLQLGPIATRISNIGKAALPVIGTLGALASAYAAVGTAAAGAGAAMGGILTGGLMLLAQQAAARKEAMKAASGKQLSPKQANVTMWEGMDIVKKNLKQQLKEATAPLRQPIFAQFTLGAIEQVMAVVHDFSQFAANLAPALMQVANALGAVYQSVAPEIWSQLTKTVLAFLPVIQQLLTGALRALPGFLAFIRKRGKELIPLLMELGGAVLEMLPALIKMGSNILQIVIPAITFLVRAITPAIKILSWLSDILGVISDLWTAIPEPIRATAAAVIGLTFGIGRLITLLPLLGRLAGWAAGLLSALGVSFSTLTGILAGAWTVISGVASAILTIGAAIVSIIGWPLTLAAAIAGLITYFHAWDDIMNIISGTISALVGLVDWVVGGIADFLVELASLVGFGDELMWFFQSVDYWVRRIAGALRILKDLWNWFAGGLDWLAGSTDEWFSRATDDVAGQTPTKKKNREGGGKGPESTPFPEAPQTPPGKYPKVDTGGAMYRGSGKTTVNNVEITAPKNAQMRHIRSIVRQEINRAGNESRQRNYATN